MDVYIMPCWLDRSNQIGCHSCHSVQASRTARNIDNAGMLDSEKYQFAKTRMCTIAEIALLQVSLRRRKEAS